jgi:GNAT superfamily N-acetyltransferase
LKYNIENIPPNTLKLTLHDFPNSYLEFSPPDICCSEVIIQNLKVSTRRKGIGTKLLNCLKKLVREKYNCAAIRVLSISPLVDDITVEELIKFYKSNGFRVYQNDQDIEGIYEFVHK